MLYCLVNYPQIDTRDIDILRNKYDRDYANVIAPHITLVFPMKTESIDKATMQTHIEGVLSRYQPFDLRLHGLRKSWDNWLFLEAEGEGGGKLVEIHDELYTGPLERHLWKEAREPFGGHIGLGEFNQQGSGYHTEAPSEQTLDSRRYNEAFQEAEHLRLDYTTRIDSLSLLTLDTNENGVVNRIVESVNLPLGIRK